MLLRHVQLSPSWRSFLQGHVPWKSTLNSPSFPVILGGPAGPNFLAAGMPRASIPGLERFSLRPQAALHAGPQVLGFLRSESWGL